MVYRKFDFHVICSIENCVRSENICSGEMKLAETSLKGE